MGILKIKNSITGEWETIQAIKGDKGDRGIPGKTPVKYVDYFTDKEIEEIKKDITNSILTNIGDLLKGI